MTTELPATSMEQSQEQAPPQQTEALQVPALQNPANEERGRKQDWEDSTPASGSTQQPKAKRKRVDPPVEEEISEEVLESPRRERETSQQTPTSSFQQEKERQHGMEVSFSTQQSKRPPNIKPTFMEIKSQNELLRVQLYDQFLKETPSKQKILMVAYDIKDEKMILSHFKPKVQQPQTATGYVITNLEVLAKDIHPMDQI